MIRRWKILEVTMISYCEKGIKLFMVMMVQFCMAYRHILEQHRLLATGTTGRLVEENAGLKVTKFLPGGHGGAEQIVARIQELNDVLARLDWKLDGYEERMLKYEEKLK